MPPKARLLLSIISRADGAFAYAVRIPCAFSARTASSAISSAPSSRTCVWSPEMYTYGSELDAACASTIVLLQAVMSTIGTSCLAATVSYTHLRAHETPEHL